MAGGVLLRTCSYAAPALHCLLYRVRRCSCSHTGASKARSPEQGNARSEFCCMYLYSPIEERATDTTSPCKRVFTGRRGTTRGSGIPKKGMLQLRMAVLDKEGWHWLGRSGCGLKDGAEAGHSAARGDGLGGLCGDAGCSSGMEQEGCSQWICSRSYTGLGPW